MPRLFLFALLSFVCHLPSPVLGYIKDVSISHEVVTPQSTSWTVPGDHGLCHFFNHSANTVLALENLVTMISQGMEASYQCGPNCRVELANSFRTYWPDEYEEVVTLVACISTFARGFTVTTEDIVSLAYLQEVSHIGIDYPQVPRPFGLGCTGILACSIEGHIVHGRNLDWETPEELVHLNPWYWPSLHTSFCEEKTCNRQTYDSIDSFFGLSGVLSGVNENLSISMNWRHHSVIMNYTEPNFNFTKEEMLSCIKSSSTAPATYTLRKALKSGMNYDQAVAFFTEATFCIPVYIIIGGKGKGTVITKAGVNMPTPPAARNLFCGRIEGSTTEDGLDIPVIPPWYLVQTNFDTKEQGLQYSDHRWVLAMEKLNKQGQIESTRISSSSSTHSGMWNVLSVPDTCMPPSQLSCRGVLNFHTLYSAVMDPENGVIHDNMFRLHVGERVEMASSSTEDRANGKQTLSSSELA